MIAANSTTRFSDRAINYTLYRPGYPTAIITYLEQEIGMNSHFTVADIGAGTGLFAALFLESGYPVKAVEPNEAMRAAAAVKLQAYNGVEIIDGTAEHSSLPDHSIDLITVAQAFHWFQLDEVKKEFTRILKPGGHVLLAWNILQTDTPFLKAYDILKERYAEKDTHPDFGDTDLIVQFFAPNPVFVHQIKNTQSRDMDGIKGLLASSSKVPQPGSAHFDSMMNELETLAKQYAADGLLNMEYITKLYLGKMGQ